MAHTDIEVDKLAATIRKMLEDYSDVVFEATEKALTKGEQRLIKIMKSTSPNISSTREYRKSWKGKKKYKTKRYVGNTKFVTGAKDDIPLTNILEYSEKSPYQGLIQNTFNSSVDEIANAIFDEIRKGV